jgi:hypothetical protein
MGEEKPKIEDLVKRIDDLIRVLKFLSEDLANISTNLKAGLGSHPPSQAAEPSRPLPQPKSSQQTIPFTEPSAAPILIGGVKSAEDVQKVFPQDLSSMLYFEETDGHVLVKPRLFLGSDNFRRIANIIRDQLGGEYVSAGKDSHFRISKKA